MLPSFEGKFLCPCQPPDRTLSTKPMTGTKLEHACVVLVVGRNYCFNFGAASTL